MFDPTSRYYDIETATIDVPGSTGPRTIAYKRRRFIPADADAGVIVEHTLGPGERLDLISAAYLGDPTQFWRICDANRALRPSDLEQPANDGQPVVIKVPVG